MIWAATFCNHARDKPATESLSLDHVAVTVLNSCSKGNVPLLSFHDFLAIWADGQSRFSLSHRELKHNILPSEPLVDASKGVELVLCAVAFLGVQVDLCGTDMREVRVSTRSRQRQVA